MADICNKCGKMIVIPFNELTEERANGRIVTFHGDCNIDNWDDFEKSELEEMRELED